MDITFDVSDGVGALARVLGCVDRRNTIPVLSCVLIEAKGDGVRLYATNLDMDAWAIFPAKVATEGAVSIQAGMLADALKSFAPGAEANLTFGGAPTSKATLKCGRSRVGLPALPEVDYPRLATPEWATSLPIDSDALAEPMGRAAPCAATEIARAYWCGVHLTGDFVVALNGFVITQIRCAHDFGADVAVTVPSRAVTEAIRALGLIDNATLNLSPGRFGLEYATGGFTAKTIDVEFPNWRRVTREAGAHVVAIDKAPLIASIRRAQMVSDAKDRWLSMGFSNGLLTLSSAGDFMGGESHDEMEIDYAGPDLSVRVTCAHLMDGLDALRGDRIEIGVTDAATPLVLRDPSDADTLINIGVRR